MGGDAVTVLIVESNRNSALTLEFLFAQNGYRVSVAHSGEEALERCETSPVSLAVITARLPFRSGFELCQIISNRATKVILLLESDSGPESEKARAMGASAWFAKPFSPKELVRAARTLLEGPP